MRFLNENAEAFLQMTNYDKYPNRDIFGTQEHIFQWMALRDID
jgi:hypothetical protein